MILIAPLWSAFPEWIHTLNCNLRGLIALVSGCMFKLYVLRIWIVTLIARLMGLTWGPSGADRTQVGPLLAPWILLTGEWRTTLFRILFKRYPRMTVKSNATYYDSRLFGRTTETLIFKQRDSSVKPILISEAENQSLRPRVCSASTLKAGPSLVMADIYCGE